MYLHSLKLVLSACVAVLTFLSVLHHRADYIFSTYIFWSFEIKDLTLREGMGGVAFIINAHAQTQ